MTYRKNAQSHYKQGRIENVQVSGRRSKGTKLKADQKMMDEFKPAKPREKKGPEDTVVEADAKITEQAPTNEQGLETSEEDAESQATPSEY